MLGKAQITDIINDILQSLSLKIYDLEFFPSKNQTLQVFLQKTGNETEKKGISLDDCAKASKAISRDERLESFFEDFALEVSSPGIERKIRTPEHFQAAIGERLKLVLKFGSHAGKAVFGELKSFLDNNGTLIDETNQGAVDFAFADVKSARVALKL